MENTEELIQLKNENQQLKALVSHLESRIKNSNQPQANVEMTARMLEQTGAIAKVGGWELDLKTQKLYWTLETCRIHELEIMEAPSVENAINFYTPEARPLIASAFQDITDRIKSAADLRQLSERLSFATRAGGVGIWDYNIVENILTWDNQMLAFRE